MALTSTTGTVDSDEVTFSVEATGKSKGEGVMAYVNYVQGGGDSDISIGVSFNEPDLDTNFYQQVYLANSTAVTVLQMIVNATGKYRIPLSMAQNEHTVKLAFSGLVDGDLNVEFRIDNPYF